jgi:hypothetical protein
MRNYVGKDEP